MQVNNASHVISSARKGSAARHREHRLPETLAGKVRPANMKPDKRHGMRMKCWIDERKVITECADLNRGGQFVCSTASSPTGC
jgi:hypothetical protein